MKYFSLNLESNQLTIPRLILIFILLFSINGFSQSHRGNGIVDGQLLIMPSNNNTIEEVITSLKNTNTIVGRVKIEQKLSTALNIWLISYDHIINNQEAVLAKCNSLETINIAQFNHLLEHRIAPNDASYSSQWQYDNSGANGGVVDADIDAPEAWDVTTGGLTMLGDTIVVCVIDDGFDRLHPDLINNTWINYHEIPGNGIDDDNNGYIDDYYGWNADNNNGTIPAGFGHGTSVAGIVGAEGDNAIGVSGVNWNVKLMNVKGGGNEAQAIAAYSYPLIMRKLYNQSNGSAGAFVVATNASWGINYGQPSSSPLWCAMYDTLGYYGILSAGATANLNIDVDIDGDLPTGCASPYLIAVTNTKNNDVKELSAGYGSIAIDIGAPGTDTYTTQSNNSYGGFGGTSGATPHVAGVIALLYSAPCNNFIFQAKANPAQAALDVKNWILNGGDVNSSLQGITVSGNRLNAFGAINQLLTACPSMDTCFAPGNTLALNITQTKTEISWTNFNQSNNVDLRYREVGSSTWTTISGVTSPYLIQGLIPCTDYEFELESICASNPYITSQLFNSGCCSSPPNVTTLNVNNSSTISWTSTNFDSLYNIRYKPVSGTVWFDSLGLNTPNVTLSDLIPCTPYEIQIETNCSISSSGYGTSFFFTSPGCGACIDSIYCSSIGQDTGYEWIDNVTFNTINNTSGDDSGYGDFTGNNDFVEIGKTYDLSVTPGYSSAAENEHITAWIDYNFDGDFDDVNETIYAVGPVTSTTVGGITIPSSASVGLTRLRIAMRWNNDPVLCDDMSYGEVEDYCIELKCPSLDSIITQTGGVLTADISGSSYQWLTCPGMDIITGANNENYSPSSNGTYAVVVTTDFCVDTSSCYNFSTSGIIENDFGNRLQLYPNPTEGDFSVDLGKQYENTSITITDLFGRTIQSKTYKDRQVLNLKLLESAGVYLLSIESGNKKAVLRIEKN